MPHLQSHADKRGQGLEDGVLVVHTPYNPSVGLPWRGGGEVRGEGRGGGGDGGAIITGMYTMKRWRVTQKLNHTSKFCRKQWETAVSGSVQR